MPGMPNAGKLVLTAVIAGFLFGVVHLFLLRFEAGDSYPAYSSLRADPLGTKALYESLGGLEGMTVLRNYQPFSKFVPAAKGTLFLCGMPLVSLNGISKQEARSLESIAVDGGRIVLLLLPVKDRKPREMEKSDAAGKERAGEKPREKRAAGNEPEREKDNGSIADAVALGERWKFGISVEEFPAGADKPVTMAAAPRQGMRELVQPLSWHSSLWFEGMSPDWRIVYEREGRPVLIERRFGKGTIVLASDSYFTSNEAMVNERRPELLAWLVGGNAKVIFDETHLGIVESPGVAALGRKYRLQGIAAALLVLAALFIWKNSTSLVPPRDGFTETSDGVRTSRDHLSGFAGLLRRTVPPHDILAVCVEEWKKSNRKGVDRTGDIARVEAIVNAEARRSARDRDPVQAYRAIQKLLSERKQTS